MADDKLRNGEETPEEKKKKEEDDSGALTGDSQQSDLGNLPPLGDFESSESDSESDSDSISGLPPIGDINVETPTPTGGNVRAAPPGFESNQGKERPDLDTPFSDSRFDTPESDAGGTGFDALSADSDFTPETPELGAGSDSDMETPMFDSAFGGGDSDFDTPQTSAPTQAMETPMFGGDAGGTGGGGTGFDTDAFGGGSGDTFGSAFEGGTPVPDFSPDTGAPTQATPPPVAGPPRMQPSPAGRGGGGGIGVVGVLLGILLLIVGLAVGIFLGPTVTHTYWQEAPMNPWSDDVDRLESETRSLNARVNDLSQQLREITALDDPEVSPEEIAALQAEKEELTAQRNALAEAVQSNQQQLAAIEREIEMKSEEYVRAEEEYEELLNQTSITLARRDGLLAEVDRLQDQVGSLEQADQRRRASRDALRHAANLLAVRVREGSPLTPEKYARANRIAAVENLKSQIEGKNWVDPELLNQYTELYLTELEIAGSREYFFARIPVTDRWGVTHQLWAECLMNGNWSVYFRTIDGRHIGVFENVAPTGPARYEFRKELPGVVTGQIEETIITHRVDGFEEKLAVLADKQMVIERKTSLQRIFDSL